MGSTDGLVLYRRPVELIVLQRLSLKIQRISSCWGAVARPEIVQTLADLLQDIAGPILTGGQYRKMAPELAVLSHKVIVEGLHRKCLLRTCYAVVLAFVFKYFGDLPCWCRVNIWRCRQNSV